MTPPRARQKQKREASTVNDILKGLRRFSKWCVSRGYLDTDPTEGLRGLRERDRVIFAPETDEVTQLVFASLDHGETPELVARNFAVMCVLVDIGVRAAELVSMNLGDVWDGKNVKDTVMVVGKGDKQRLAPINPPVRGAIADYLKLRRPRPGEFALWVDKNGERMTYIALRNMVRELGKRAGVKVGLHDFRRFTHTMLWLQGIDQIDGMMLSGHTRDRDYKVYIRSAMQKRAVEKARAMSPLAKVL